MNINWDDAYYMQKTIAKMLFGTNENYCSKYTNNISLDLDLNKLKINLVTTSDEFSIKEMCKNNIKSIKKRVEELFGLKNPIKRLYKIDQDNINLNIYRRRCKLVYYIDNNFMNKIYAITKIQTKEFNR